MKGISIRNFFSVLIALLLAGTSLKAQTVVIGPTTGSSSYLYGPYYRSSAASSFNYSRYAYIYTAAELSIPTGSVITEIAWYKSAGTMSGNNTFQIWLDNTSATTLGASSAWNTVLGTATSVYSSTTQAFSAANNSYEAFTLTTPFTYTGGSLKILTDHVKSGTASGANNYYYESASGMAIGYASSTAPTATTTLSSSSYGNNRPTIRITYIPGTPCTDPSITFPSSATSAVSDDTLCLSGDVMLNVTTQMPPAGGINYQWQSAPAATGPWTNIGTPQILPAKSVTGINATTYYRCQIYCNTTLQLTSSTVMVYVNNPGTPTAINGTRCGPGTVNLAVTPPAGAGGINWYGSATGGAPLGAGNTFTTPYLTTNTTFYAAANSGSTTVATGKPTPVSTSGNSGFSDIGLMFDAYSAFTILSVDVYPVSTSSTSGTVDIALKNSSGTILQSTTATVTVGPGGVLNTVPLNFTVAPGTNYRLVLTSASGMTTILRESLAANINYPYTVPGVSSITSAYTGGPSSTYYYYFYNWLISTGCEGNRIPVTATITPPPAFSKTAPAVLCSNSIGTIQVTSPLGNYSNYSWTPTTDLYTNAAATTPYTGGSASTLYFKSSTAGQHTYYLYATNSSGSQCSYADTTRIWVQPDSVIIMAYPDTVCAPSGSTTLKLVPSADYATNSIQWQESNNGTNYTDIVGATGITYVTPSLSANRWYRALIKAGSTNCETPSKLIVVVDPQLVSWSDSFNCGPGTVTLQAASAGNSSIRWYDSPTSNMPIATGSPWTTPYLGASTTYYVGAGTGAIQPAPTNVVVTGTQNSGTTSVFLYYYYKGAKTQYIITAAEMQAQGFGQGLITALGIETGSIGNTTMNNVSIQLGSTTLTTLTSFQSGLQLVYSAATYTLTANATNTFTFQTPFYWDGSSNIIVDICRINNATNTSINNYVYRTSSGSSSVYRYGDANDMCSAGSGMPTGGTAYGPYTSTTRPHTIFTMLGGCESPREEVIAYIRPVPEVDLGQDINRCVDEGAVVVLDAGVQPNNGQYLWDNGSTSQVRAITQSGTYDVTVTNEYTCVGSDTIDVILRANPVVELGNDTSVCNGVTLTLNAGNDGIEYFWSTGQTTQTIDVNSPGTYNVFVTNNQACTKADTITVNMSGELPTIQGISITNNGNNTFLFTAVNPQNVIGYDWDFGDGTPHSYQASPAHTYANTGNYVVTLTLSSTCGFWTDSTSAHIVGIDQINVSKEEMMIYPNPTRETATILNKGTLKMEKVEVYNVLGQVIYSASADSKDKHTLQLSGLASGVYTVQIVTDKGTVTRKLEILK